MRLLLDSHIAIWALTNDPRLSEAARELLLDDDNEVFVSAVSVWEIAIKHSLGRRRMPFSGTDATRYFREAGYRLLDFTPAHAAGIERLPPIHTDPFDRLLLAQARSEPLHLLTHDAVMARYGDPVLRV